MPQGPLVYIMCGLCFAGKTSIASEIASTLGYIHLDVDEIYLEKLALAAGTGQITGGVWDKAFEECFRRSGLFLTDEKTVVYDGANASLVERDEIRDFARRYNAGSLVIYVDVPEEV